MSTEIKVPQLPESINEATISTWHKKPGEAVKRDENLVDIETDKVVLEVVAPADGSLEKILKETGTTVKAEEVIGLFKEGAGAAFEVKPAKEEKREESKEKQNGKNKEEKIEKKIPQKKTEEKEEAKQVSPSLRRLASEQGVDLQKLQGTGEGGSITKEDILKASGEKEQRIEKGKEKPETPSQETTPKEAPEKMMEGRSEKRVPMTRLRARIAERLLEAQHNAAILTTFNEINMQAVMNLRQKYRESFEKNYGVRLGYMSFFTLAVIEALKHFPAVNASIDGNDIVYHAYYDIGIAVSTPRGLVVPVVKNAESLSMADIEKQIASLAKKADTGKLTMDEITGGTFTITNGGVFGSLMATPILNPPQSAILGMHKIQERPVAENGQVVIRPMMYVALSYDHRIIDGKESVSFLVLVKELLEDPARLALGF